jgi:glucose-6-phosphate dehydrogenase assembly protein OpcA
MEKAVSASPTNQTGDGHLAEFERGDAIEVAPEKIETELAQLWRRAAESKPGDAPKPVTRACLWNLVVRVQGEPQFMHIKRVIDELSQRIPARAIVTRFEDGPDSLRAFVEANWRRAGGVASGSDEVTLWATGEARFRLPSLVRALLFSDAPTAIFWPGALPPLEERRRDFTHEADRLVVDTRKLASEDGLVELCEYAAKDPELEVADLSWIGISPLRGLATALFDPPRDPAQLQKVDRVRVTSNIVGGTQARGLLALGWLVSRLGWRDLQKASPSPELRRWTATRKDGQPVTLELATQAGAASHGVAGLELYAGQSVWSLVRDECIHVRGPDSPARTQPARSHSDAELVASALGARGRDTIFKEALAQGAALVRA